MSTSFPAGEHDAWITLSRYRTWAGGRIVYQASVVSRDEAYSHFGDDPGVVTEWMDKREREQEVVSENETRERGRFKISVDGSGIISILAELEDAGGGETFRSSTVHPLDVDAPPDARCRTCGNHPLSAECVCLD